MFTNRVDMYFSYQGDGKILYLQTGDENSRFLQVKLWLWNGDAPEEVDTSGLTAGMVYTYNNGGDSTDEISCVRQDDGSFLTLIPIDPLLQKGSVEAQLSLRNIADGQLSHSAILKIEVLKSLAPNAGYTEQAVTQLTALLAQFPTLYSPIAHGHGNVSSDGKLGAAANLPVFTGTDGLLQAITAESARTKLGLGDAATKTVGTGAGQIPVLDENGKIDSSLISAVIAALTAGGVVSGGLVAEMGTPGQGVSIPETTYITDEGKLFTVAADTAFALPAADGTNPRYDLVTGDDEGAFAYTEGTPDSSPTVPATPAHHVLLAVVTRAANDNTVSNAEIEDRRRFISVPSDGEDLEPVTESSNTFALDLGLKKKKAFSFTIDNTTGKTITISNRSYGDCDVYAIVKFTATAAVTHTLDGDTLSWVGGVAPSFVTGYTYELLYSYSALLGKWIGRFNQGVAN